MLRLALILYAMVATTLAGIGVIAVLSAGVDDWVAITGAAAVGAALAVPGSWAVARMIRDNIR